jgi:hypothetical protein
MARSFWIQVARGLLLNPAMRMTSKEAQYKVRPKQRCEVCSGRFGLIRHRLAFKQFCSRHCLNQYLASLKEAIRKHGRGLAKQAAAPGAFKGPARH